MEEVIRENTGWNKRKWLLVSAIIFFVLLALAAAGLAAFNKYYQGKIYRNIYLGDYNLSGLTEEQAKRLINQAIDKISQRGVNFSYKDSSVAVTPVVSSADGDLAIRLINFNAEKTAAEAFSYGRGDNFFINLKNKLLLQASRHQLALTLSANQAEIKKILDEKFSTKFEPAEDASLRADKTPAGAYEFSLTGEKLGKTMDYDAAVSKMLNNLINLDGSEIVLLTATQYPKLLVKDALNIESKAEAILAAAPLTLTFEKNSWTLSRDQLADLLGLKPNDSAVDKIKVGLDEEKTKAYFKEKIAPEINREPQEAKFEMTDGKVTKFQNGRDGLELDPAATISKIENELGSAAPIELAVKIKPALVTADNINNYGVKDLIGVGSSSFAGSPPNRRHNIKIGADSVNGTLIKPGEEFSLLKTLGKIDGSTGYLPELVIKEGRTVPEYGGGLCQIGTTVFRAALATGLPITMRQNHSYRVGYYEPAGTDATIYDPWPDFRFLNDTGNYILIQSKISGDDLSFEFWGTDDGRLVEKTEPVIYNIVKPGPAKIIETTDLKPGEKKCTEKAHNGADAYFDYKVTYAGGETKEKRFTSHYVPWREVCLLGVEKSSEPPDTASSTPAN